MEWVEYTCRRFKVHGLLIEAKRPGQSMVTVEKAEHQAASGGVQRFARSEEALGRTRDRN
jgi:hypothetical protein